MVSQDFPLRVSITVSRLMNCYWDIPANHVRSFSGLGNLAWSFAKQAQLADAVMESIINSSGRLAVYETMCLDVGESLIHRLFTNIATSALHHDGGLSRFKPQG